MFDSREAMKIVHQGQHVPPNFGSEPSEENRVHLFLNSVGGLQKQVDEISQQSFVLPPATRPLNAQERHWLATRSAKDIVAVPLPEEPVGKRYER